MGGGLGVIGDYGGGWKGLRGIMGVLGGGVGGGGGGDTRRHCFKGARMPQKGTDVRKVMGNT